MYAVNLPWEQSNDILQWAIEEKTQLRITLRLGKEWNELPSQFMAGESLKNLSVTNFPLPCEAKLLTSQLLPCSFRKGHRKYLFVSAILNSSESVIDGVKQDLIVLTWPEGVQQVQRRLYFRASIPIDMNLSVRIWPSVPAIDTIPSVPPIHSAKLLDISAGGCQAEMNIPDALVLEKSYLLEIELPKPEPSLLVQAQARRVQANVENDKFSYGLQFLSLDHTPRGQATLMKLARLTNYLRSLQPTDHRAS